MKTELMIFKGHGVEILELNEEVLFNPYHTGECLELGESAVRMAISKMSDRQVRKVKNSDVKDIDFRKLNNAGENFLTESGVYKLVFKSHKANAEEFTDWITDEVLPQLRQTGTYTMKNRNQQSIISLKEQLEAAAFVAEELHIPQSNKIMMFRKVCENNNVNSNFLPAYSENEDREAKPATELLEKFQCGISARKFNELLLKAGYLEERERKSGSSKTGMKKFKTLTEKGLRYGKNLVCEKNVKETQPYYYVDTFLELYHLVMQGMV